MILRSISLCQKQSGGSTLFDAEAIGAERASVSDVPFFIMNFINKKSNL